MKYGFEHALSNLRPGAGWVMRGTRFDSDGSYRKGLDWQENKDTGQKIPTYDSCMTEINRLNNAEAMNILRDERNKKLSDLDWEVTKAISTTGTVDAKLKTYMQELRDLPSSANQVLDSDQRQIISGVTWPTRG